MRFLIAFLSGFLLIGAAQADEIVSPFSQPDTVWYLSELAGSNFEQESTLVFGAEGRVSGKALCNRFAGQAKWTAENLVFSAFAMTKMACLDMDNEHAITTALNAVVSGGIIDGELVLALEDGTQMIYRATK